MWICIYYIQTASKGYSTTLIKLLINETMLIPGHQSSCLPVMKACLYPVVRRDTFEMDGTNWQTVPCNDGYEYHWQWLREPCKSVKRRFFKMGLCVFHMLVITDHLHPMMYSPFWCVLFSCACNIVHVIQIHIAASLGECPITKVVIRSEIYDKTIDI